MSLAEHHATSPSPKARSLALATKKVIIRALQEASIHTHHVRGGLISARLLELPALGSGLRQQGSVVDEAVFAVIAI